MRWIKQIFRQLTVQEMAAAELQEAHRVLFEAQQTADHAHAVMHYQHQRVARLEAVLKGDTQ